MQDQPADEPRGTATLETQQGGKRAIQAHSEQTDVFARGNATKQDRPTVLENTDTFVVQQALQLPSSQ